MKVNNEESWIIASEIVDALYPSISLTIHQQEKIAAIISDKNNRAWNERQQDWVVCHSEQQAFDNGRDAEKRTGEYGELEY